jgi:hypothetical protein
LSAHRQALAFAPLHYLPPAKYEAELNDGEAQFHKLWKEAPWLD